MKDKGATMGRKSPAKNGQVTSKEFGSAVTGKFVAKPAATGAIRISGTVQYIDLGNESGEPAHLAASDVKATKGPFVSVFHVVDRAALTKTLKLARQAPHLGHPTIAVVSPEVFNEPDLRQAIVEGYSDVLVQEPEEIGIARLVRFFEKSTRPILHKLAKRHREPAQPQASVEASLTGLSARLRDPSGRLDARKISDLLGITMTDLATKVCGVTKQALSQSPTSAGIQDKLQPLEDAAQLLHWCGGDEAKLRAWLKRPNPDFPEIEGKTPSPVDLILRGHAGIVARKVHKLRTGHPA